MELHLDLDRMSIGELSDASTRFYLQIQLSHSCSGEIKVRYYGRVEPIVPFKNTVVAHIKAKALNPNSEFSHNKSLKK